MIKNLQTKDYKSQFKKLYEKYEKVNNFSKKDKFFSNSKNSYILRFI